jgi:hypothetical protein
MLSCQEPLPSPFTVRKLIPANRASRPDPRAPDALTPAEVRICELECEGADLRQAAQISQQPAETLHAASLALTQMLDLEAVPESSDYSLQRLSLRHAMGRRGSPRHPGIMWLGAMDGRRRTVRAWRCVGSLKRWRHRSAGSGASFDEDRLLVATSAPIGAPTERIQEAVAGAVAGFVGDTPQADHMALAIAIHEM